MRYILFRSQFPYTCQITRETLKRHKVTCVILKKKKRKEIHVSLETCC